MKRPLGLLFLLLITAVETLGCKSAQPVPSNAIVIGMPRRDVILLRGTPDRTIKEQDREILVYRLHQNINDPYAPDIPYWVILKDGKVVKHGRTDQLKASGETGNSVSDAEISF